MKRKVSKFKNTTLEIQIIQEQLPEVLHTHTHTHIHTHTHTHTHTYKATLKNFAILTGKQRRSLFSIKLQAFRPATLLKRDSNTDALPCILQNPQERLP